MSSTDLLARFLDPTRQAALVAEVLGDETPERAQELASLVETHWRSTRDPAHALSAADLHLVAGLHVQSAQVLGELVSSARLPPNSHRLRLAGARIATHAGDDFAPMLVELGARILPPADGAAELVRAGSYLRLNVLADATVIDPAKWPAFSTSPDALFATLSTLFGPSVMHYVTIGALLRSLTLRESPPTTASSIASKRMLFVRATGEQLPSPPHDASSAALWARHALRSFGLSLENDGYRAVVNRMIAVPIDETLRALDQIVSEFPRHAFARSARANVRLQRTLGALETGAEVELGSELQRVFDDASAAIGLVPHDLTSWMVMGWFAAELDHDTARAISIYDHVLTFSPWHPIAIRYRGVNRIRAGDGGGEVELKLADKLLPTPPHDA